MGPIEQHAIRSARRFVLTAGDWNVGDFEAHALTTVIRDHEATEWSAAFMRELNRLHALPDDCEEVVRLTTEAEAMVFRFDPPRGPRGGGR